MAPGKYCGLLKAAAYLEMMLLRKGIIVGWPERKEETLKEIRTVYLLK